MSRKKKLIIGLVIVFLLGGASGGLYFLHFKPISSPISAELKKQVPFQIYYPSSRKYILSNDSSYYDSALGLFFSKFTKDTQSFTITQQSKPGEFSASNIDGTQFLTKFGTGFIINNIIDKDNQSADYNIDISRVAGISGILLTTTTIVSVNNSANNSDSLRDLISVLEPL